MSVVSATVDVAVPIRTAYNHWTSVEELPTFFGELEQACMVADRTMRWKVKLGATTREFDMLITEQVPDERVSWAWTEKSQHFATITFSRLDNDHTRVSAELELDTELKEMWRTLPGEAGIPSNRLSDYLRRFRDFAEGHDGGANR